MRIKGLPDSVVFPLRVLNKIATCRAVDRLRSQARWTGVLGALRIEEDDDSQEALESGPLYGGELNRVEVQHDLALLTKGESPQTLVMAVLYYVDGCTIEEIAALAGISRRTVSTSLHRFVERARKRSARFSGGGDA